jgi:hypothetical protein
MRILAIPEVETRAPDKGGKVEVLVAQEDRDVADVGKEEDPGTCSGPDHQ